MTSIQDYATQASKKEEGREDRKSKKPQTNDNNKELVALLTTPALERLCGMIMPLVNQEAFEGIALYGPAEEKFVERFAEAGHFISTEKSKLETTKRVIYPLRVINTYWPKSSSSLLTLTKDSKDGMNERTFTEAIPKPGTGTEVKHIIIIGSKAHEESTIAWMMGNSEFQIKTIWHPESNGRISFMLFVRRFKSGTMPVNSASASASTTAIATGTAAATTGSSSSSK